MIVNSFVLLKVNAKYRMLHVKLAEFVNLIVDYWD